MNLLFGAHPTVGHTQALRAIARAMASRGHSVRFATPHVPRLPRWLPLPAALLGALHVDRGLTADGFERLTLPVSLSTGLTAMRIAQATGYEELKLAMRLFLGNAEEEARFLLGAFERQRPDAVVADFALLSAWMAAEKAQIPFFALFHSGLPFPVPGHPPVGSGLGAGTPRSAWAPAEQALAEVGAISDGLIAVARARLGLPIAPGGLLQRPFAPAGNLVVSHEAFELPRPELAAQAAGPVHWVGPCLGERMERDEEPFPWERIEAAGARPLAFVSLGTVFNGKPALYRTLVEGLLQAGLLPVVAAGASTRALQAVLPAEVVVVPFAPQVRLLERVALAAIHGGNNSTNEALLAGVPLLVLPFGGDQIDNAMRVEWLKVGRRLDARTLTPEGVAEAARPLLTPEARARSKALAARAPKGDGVARAVAVLERAG